jgi:phage antirepressor YoqD-like protein
MSNLRIYDYNGFPVQFDEVNGRIMANATTMAAPFGKQPKDWLKTEKAKNYIETIGRKVLIPDYEIVVVKSGSPDNGGGTWIHEKLILRFAQFLSTDFEIWCDDKIAELIRNGRVELSPQSEAEAVLVAFNILNRAVEKERKEKEAVVLKLKEAEPKIQYHDEVLRSDSLHNITTVANKLRVSAQKLNKWLKEDKIQHKVGGVWVINTEYLDLGFAEYHTHTARVGDKIKTFKHLKWTELGLKFIYNRYKYRVQLKIAS